LAVLAAASGVNPWKFHPHPEVWLILGSCVGLFAYAVWRIGPTQVVPGEPVITKKQKCMFGSGVLLLLIASSWPVHDLAERYLYSVHMLQHLLISLAAPPLLMLGTPVWLQRKLLSPAPLSWVIKRICRPIPAAVIFNVVIAVGHAPFWVNYTLEHDWVHFLAHLLLFVVSLVMWFPVFNQMPEYPRLGQPAAMIYLFIQSLLPNAPVAFLTFADSVVYKFYATVPRPFAMTAVEDQQLAGAVMKIGGTLIIWSIILVQFFRWYQREHGDPFAARRTPRPVLPEVLTWDDVESELSKPQPRP
jgi:putative membrane protein